MFRTTSVRYLLFVLVVVAISAVACAQTTEIVMHDQVFLGYDDMYTMNGVATFSDPTSFVHAEIIDIEPHTQLALPDQEGEELALLVIYDVTKYETGTPQGWGGISIGHAPTDLTVADGIRFNFYGIGTGNYFSLNFHEGDDPSTPECENESYSYDWIDDTDGWVVIEVRFSDLVEDSWQLEHAVVDGFDGTAVQELLIDAFGAGFFVIEGISLITGP